MKLSEWNKLVALEKKKTEMKKALEEGFKKGWQESEVKAKRWLSLLEKGKPLTL